MTQFQQIIKSWPKSFEHIDGLLQHTSDNTRKRKHSVASTTSRKMSQEILHRLGDERRMYMGPKM